MRATETWRGKGGENAKSSRGWTNNIGTPKANALTPHSLSETLTGGRNCKFISFIGGRL